MAPNKISRREDRRFAIIVAALAASCSSAPATSPSTVTPSTFVMTWPGLAFPPTGVGATSSTPIVVTLWNTGGSGVPVVSVSTSNGDEFPVTTTCQIGGMLTPSSTCNVTARFKPSALGARSANVTINANSATQTLALTGTGALVNPQLVLVPAGDVAPNVFTLSGTNSTPGGTVELHTTYMAAASTALIALPVTTWKVEASGNVTATFMTDVGGTYEHWLVDLTSGLSTNHVVHIVE